jgi:hypothetical protein
MYSNTHSNICYDSSIRVLEESTIKKGGQFRSFSSGNSQLYVKVSSLKTEFIGCLASGEARLLQKNRQDEKFMSESIGQMGQSYPNNPYFTSPTSNGRALQQIKSIVSNIDSSVHKIAETLKQIKDTFHRYLSTIRRIRLEPEQSFPIEEERSEVDQINFELSMTDELLERINFCNSKVKSRYQYRLEFEDISKSETQVSIA